MDANVTESGSERRRGFFIALVAVPVLLLAAAAAYLVFGRTSQARTDLAAANAYVMEERGDLQSALAMFREGAIANPGTPRFHFEAGRIAEQLDELDAARSDADRAWDSGFRTRESCELLVRVHLEGVEGDEFFERASVWFEALPEAERSRELLGDIHFRGDRVEEAIEIWHEQVIATREFGALEKLVGVLVRQGRENEAWELMDGLRESRELDESGFSLLAMLAAGRSSATLDHVCRDAKSSGNAGIRFRMQDAMLRLSLNQLDRARAAFETCSAARKGVPREENFHACQARIFLGYLCLIAGDAEGLAELAGTASNLPENAMAEGETIWFRLLQKRLSSGEVTDFEELEQVLRVSGNHPAVHLLLAQSCAKHGDGDAALEQFAAIDGLLAQWLPVTLGIAAVHHHHRHDDLRAAKIIAGLHARGVRTEASAAIVHSIAACNGLALADHGAAKKMIPVIEEVLVGELDAARGHLQEHLGTQLGARLGVQLDLLGGHQDLALQSMRKLDGAAGDWIVLAGVADRHQLWQAAEFAYSKALGSRPEDPVLLNNWASAKLKLEGFADQPGEIPGLCRRLHEEHPQNPVILDTLAECLMRTGKLDECAQLLTSGGEKIAPPALLLRLGRAYESAGQGRRAAECLKRCRDSQDALGHWNLPISRTELDRQIATLDA